MSKVYVCFAGDQDSTDICKVKLYESDAKIWRTKVQQILDVYNQGFELFLKMEARAQADEWWNEFRDKVDGMLEPFGILNNTYNYADYVEKDIEKI